MKKLSQTEWVYNRLMKHGSVSRNECLRRQITRLASRICDLKKIGIEAIGRRVKTKNGVDYVYTLVIK